METELGSLETELADLGKEPFSTPSPKLDKLVEGARSLEQWYAADFERRIAGVSELLKAQITEELRSQFSAELKQQVDQTRKQYQDRLETQAAEWQAQRLKLEKEIEELRRKVPSNDVLAEIASMEDTITKSMNKGGMELERLLPDAKSLGALLQSRVEELERKAYLRGLKFKTSTEA